MMLRENNLEYRNCSLVYREKISVRGLDNQYDRVSITSFSNSEELFKEMAKELGATAKEIFETPNERLPRFLKELTKTIRSFIVIDDLDSLEVDEQKRCIEVCQQLSGSGSRFLFTTRKMLPRRLLPQ
jgi:hypothetical protein